MKVNIEFFHEKLADKNNKIDWIFATETTLSVIPRTGEKLILSDETAKRAGLEICEIHDCLRAYTKVTGKTPAELLRYLKRCNEVVQVFFYEKRNKPTEIYIRVRVPEEDDNFKGTEETLTNDEVYLFLDYFNW